MYKKMKIGEYKLSIVDGNTLIIINKAGTVCNFHLNERRLIDIKWTFLNYVANHYIINGDTAKAIYDKYIAMGY